jgi:hypothetical protein
MVIVSVTMAATSDLGCECLTSLSASVRVPAYSGTRIRADDERGHMMSDGRTDAHRGRRTVFRVVGGAVLFAGLLTALLGLADLFGAVASDVVDAGPTKFWMVFAGLPLMVVGGWLLQAGYARAFTSFYAEETAPAVRTTAEALGIPSDAGPGCRQCGQRAATDARFCDGCGATLG